MSYRFECSHCGSTITVTGTKGDTANCHTCGRYTNVPSDAEEVGQSCVTTDSQPQLENTRYRALRILAGFLWFLGWVAVVGTIIFIIMLMGAARGLPSGVTAVLVAASGAISAVVLMATAESIKLAIDMATDAHRSADTLEAIQKQMT